LDSNGNTGRKHLGATKMADLKCREGLMITLAENVLEVIPDVKQVWIEQFLY